METILTIIAVVFLIVEIFGILAAFHAVMNTKTSQGAIAWGISLVTFPWLALPLYAVFGRSKFHGYVLLRHVKEEKIHHIIDQCSINATEKQIVQKHNSKIGAALTRLADLPITRFNRSRLLIDGKETFQSIFNSIDAANEYILIEFFIIKDDRLGRELKNRLIHKARGKVRVYFLYDEIGSHKLPKSYIREMEREGIVTSAFQTTQGRTNRFQLNFRNHRKIVVVMDYAPSWVDTMWEMNTCQDTPNLVRGETPMLKWRARLYRQSSIAFWRTGTGQRLKYRIWTGNFKKLKVVPKTPC